MEDFNRLVDTTYKPTRDAIYDGTEPIVIALRDIQDALQTLTNLYIQQNRERSSGR